MYIRYIYMYSDLDCNVYRVCMYSIYCALYIRLRVVGLHCLWIHFMSDCYILDEFECCGCFFPRVRGFRENVRQFIPRLCVVVFFFFTGD